ncbi:acyltransferase family protein [Marinobacterium sp. YM272]|uniref:acyltransferase family protein n=1 Tax=Marinobacterium sp. YM272 TaxID=3421654 RepID=UPI003D7FEDB6
MNRSVLLDLLRIFAIALVFIAHFGQLLGTSAGGFFGIKNFYYVSLGGVGVSLFLILSGVLAGLTSSTGKTGYLTYQLKKLLRIYPLYLLSVPLAMIGYLLGDLLLNGDLPVLFPNGFGIDLLGSLTGFYAWMGLWGGPYNAPSWFIALIIVMYLLFPPLYQMLKRWPHRVLLATFLISVVSRIYVGQQGVPFVDEGLYGSVESWVYRQFGFMPGRPGDWFPPCRLFEFALGIYLAIILPGSVWSWLKAGFLARPVHYLSDLSFALFLLHYPFLFLVVWLEELGLPLPLSIGLYLVLLMALAHGVDRLDQRLPRKAVLGWLSPGRKSRYAAQH